MQKTLVIIPCYNEEKRLDTQAFLETCKKYDWLHFLFADDGSTDKTSSVIREMMKLQPGQVTGLFLKKNGGKAETIRQAYLQGMISDYQVFGFWDADLATPLHHIPLLMIELDNPEIHFVFASRIKLLGRDIQRNPIRHILGRVFATVVSLLFQIPIYDSQCGAKLFRNTPELGKLFNASFCSRWLVDVEIIARGLKYKSLTQSNVVEVPLKSWRDVEASKVRARDFFHAAIDLSKIYYRFKFK